MATKCLAPYGSDSNPGTPTQPYATVQYSLDQLAAGDTLEIYPGVWYFPATFISSGTVTSGTVNTLTDITGPFIGTTPITVRLLTGTGAGQYRGVDTVTSTKLTLYSDWGTVPSSGDRYAVYTAGISNTLLTTGTSGSPITIKAKYPRTAILVGDDTAGIVNTQALLAIGITNTSQVNYVTVDGLVLTRSGAQGIKLSGGHHNKVKNCVASWNGKTGIITSSTDDIVIEHNELMYSINEHGIYFAGSGDRAIIRYNYVHEVSSQGIQLNCAPSTENASDTLSAGSGGGDHTGYGKVTSATSNTLVDSTKTWNSTTIFPTNTVEITGGTGIGQKRTIVSNTNTSLVVTQNWDVVPDTSSNYVIYQSSVPLSRLDGVSEDCVVYGNYIYNVGLGPITNPWSGITGPVPRAPSPGTGIAIQALGSRRCRIANNVIHTGCKGITVSNDHATDYTKVTWNKPASGGYGAQDNFVLNNTIVITQYLSGSTYGPVLVMENGPTPAMFVLSQFSFRTTIKNNIGQHITGTVVDAGSNGGDWSINNRGHIINNNFINSPRTTTGNYATDTVGSNTFAAFKSYGFETATVTGDPKFIRPTIQPYNLGLQDTSLCKVDANGNYYGAIKGTSISQPNAWEPLIGTQFP